MILWREALISLKTYGPAETSAAAGIERPKFDSWIARRYIRHVPSRGGGRARLFSFEDVVKVAFMAQLEKHGISVGTASDALVLLGSEFDLALNDVETNGAHNVVLLMRYGSDARAWITSFDRLQEALSPIIPEMAAYFPIVHTIVDLTKLVRAVRSKLGG